MYLQNQKKKRNIFISISDKKLSFDNEFFASNKTEFLTTAKKFCLTKTLQNVCVPSNDNVHNT